VLVLTRVRVAAGRVKVRSNVASGAFVGLAQPDRKMVIIARINPPRQPAILFLGNMPIISFIFLFTSG
jgi:hypothetical protein